MISIIVPNYNGRGHIEKLMPTLRSRRGAEFEVILVDNGSSDDSVELAERLLPSVRMIRFDDNLGFAAACNAGAEAARGRILFFLNSDTMLDPRCVDVCAEAVRRRPDVDFFQPLIVEMDERDKLDGAGDFIPRDGRPSSRAAGLHSSTVLDPEIISPRGAAALWKKDLFERLGGFDEDFFAYLEDVDLGLRASMSGARGVYIPGAVVYHKGAGSAPADAVSRTVDRPEAVRWIARNKIWLWAKCLPASALLICAPWFVYGFAKSAAYHTFVSGTGKEFWSGTIEGILGLGKMIGKRKGIQGTRVINFMQILRWMWRTCP